MPGKSCYMYIHFNYVLVTTQTVLARSRSTRAVTCSRGAGGKALALGDPSTSDVQLKMDLALPLPGALHSDNVAVGGLRDAARSVDRLPMLKDAGRELLLHDCLSDLLANTLYARCEVAAVIHGLGKTPEIGFSGEFVQDARSFHRDAEVRRLADLGYIELWNSWEEMSGTDWQWPNALPTKVAVNVKTKAALFPQTFKR
eukprot:3220502-Amphidinium_carterae.2